MKKILLLTLVHPDFLPPVYAVAQTLRDCGYKIHILTFNSYVPGILDIGDHIEVESMGKMHDMSLMHRLKMRRIFYLRAKQIVKEQIVSIISFSPFSYLCGFRAKQGLPIIYFPLETSNFVLSDLLRSPLTSVENFRALKLVKKANLVATPSFQRSAWLSGRCGLNTLPLTIFNTSYYQEQKDKESKEIFQQLIPEQYHNKKIILYTGAVNADLCILELVQAYELLNDENSILVITGLKNSPYCLSIQEFVKNCKSKGRIILFGYLARNQMIALQSYADIGVCLTKENDKILESKMIAPNKVGEYYSKGLYVIGANNIFMLPFKYLEIASLANKIEPMEISIAIKDALNKIEDKNTKDKIITFVKDYFCMQIQCKPVIELIKNI